MASNPPVPKPRFHKPHPPSHTPQEEDLLTSKSPVTPLSTSEGLSPAQHPQPHPPPPLEVTASKIEEEETISSPPIVVPPTDPIKSPCSDYEEPLSLRKQILHLSKPTTDSEGGGGEGKEEDDDEEGDHDADPPYADIDAHNKQHSDYINFDIELSDSDESVDEDNTHHSIRKGSKYAPSVKLHSHPVLRKTQSNSEVDSPSSMTDLIRTAKKPKNRAPPPPPGMKKETNSPGNIHRGVAAGGVHGSRGHKRSRSDLCYDGGSEGQRSSVSPGQRSSVSPGQRSPASGHGSPSQDRRLPPTGSSNSNKLTVQSSNPTQKSPPISKKAYPHSSPGRPSIPMGVTEPQRTKAKGSNPSRLPPRQPPRPPPPSIPTSSTRKGDQVPQSRHINAFGEEKVSHASSRPLVLANQKLHDQEHRSHDHKHSLISPSSSASSTTTVKPKRLAPPPPAATAAIKKGHGGSPEISKKMGSSSPPAYSTVMKGQRSKLMSSGSGEEVESSTPPKPFHQSQSQSIEGLSDLTEPRMDVTSPVDPVEEILRSMDLLTIELRKDGDQDTGLVIVEGKVRSGSGLMANGIFIQQVIPESPADLDGRIQAGDMLVEVYGYEVRENFVEVLRLLEQPSSSIRIKIGRPDITSSIFSISGDKEEPIYVNRFAGTASQELLEKLERTRVKASEFERDKELALKELESLRKEALREKEELKKELEDIKKSYDQHKVDSDQRTAELSLTLATVSVERTKAENELECHKEKLEDLKEQLEQEKIKAKEEIDTIKKTLMDTEEKLKAQHRSKSENYQSTLHDLQEELAKHKEDSSKMWTELVGEKEKVAELEERLKAAESDVKVEKALNDKLQLTIEKQALQISKLKLEVERLQSKLDTPNSKDASPEITEVQTDELKTHSLPQKDAPSLPPQLNTDTSTHPESPLSEEEILIQENGEIFSEEELSEVKETLDKERSSPVVPCPYIDFVPLQVGKKTPGSKKGAESKSKLTEELMVSEAAKEEEPSKDKELPSEKDMTTESVGEDSGHGESEEAAGPNKETSEEEKNTDMKDELPATEDTASTEEPPPTDSTPPETEGGADPTEGGADPTEGGADPTESGADPTESGADPTVEQPEKVVEDATEDETEVKSEATEDSGRPVSYSDFDAIKPHNMLNTSVGVYRSKVGGAIKRKQPSREHLKKMGSSSNLLEDIPKESLSNLDKPLEDSASDAHSSPSHGVSEEPKKAPSPVPKPKPKAAPRKKPQPVPPTSSDAASKEGKKQPLAAPRSRATDKEAKVKETEGPKTGDKTAEKEPVLSAVDKITNRLSSSPARPPSIGPKPTPKKESGTGKPPTKDPVDNTTKNIPTSPTARNSTISLEKDTSELMDKDPSKLSVKEKALLAQKALLGTPEKPKPGPPVRRKPKPVSSYTNPDLLAEDPKSPTSTTPEDRMRRAQSFEDDIGASPQQRKKLPPGAFNMMMMGGVSVFGPSSDRVRSVTVSSTDMERYRGEGTPETPDSTLEETKPKDMVDGSPKEKLSPKELPAHLLKKHLDGVESESDNEGVSAPSTLPSSSTVPSSSTNGEGNESVPVAEVDYDVVLTWTPDVTALWLNRVGLGSYQQQFTERGIQGYMLFDLDNNKLKGMGIASNEDRLLFKKEVKNLKPYADRQKKLIEKLRKEEKKVAKKKKK